MPLYFAYGSNLDLRRMRERCPSARFHSRAVLRGHKLVFPRRARTRPGGVAGIQPDGASSVEGVLYLILRKDLKALDRLRGIAAGCRDRREIQVEIPCGALVTAWTCIARPQAEGPFPPPRGYMEQIVRGARQQQLSAEYVAFLQDMLDGLESSH